jgi:hypothetical protein
MLAMAKSGNAELDVTDAGFDGLADLRSRDGTPGH